MGRHISQMLLNLLDFSEAEASLVRLVVHFEILDLLKFFLGSPFNCFVVFWLSTGCLFLFFFSLIYSCCCSSRTHSKWLSAPIILRIRTLSSICGRKFRRAIFFLGIVSATTLLGCVFEIAIGGLWIVYLFPQATTRVDVFISFSCINVFFTLYFWQPLYLGLVASSDTHWITRQSRQ